MIERERILISVKTYPTLSSKYDETVCTAGFREDSTWIRIYPVPFRKFDEYERYSKFQWIEVDLERNLEDRRSESFRPRSPISLLELMPTTNSWHERRDFVLSRGTVYTNISELIRLNREGELSLATFKPSRVLDIQVKEVGREWDVSKVQAVEARSKQSDLFEGPNVDFKVVSKLPYKFSYVFEDDQGRRSTLMIEDWELGALFWRQFKKHQSESKAIEDVKSKYLNDLIIDRDIHFFLGTTLEWDARGSNPFLIIGVFSPPAVSQRGFSF